MHQEKSAKGSELGLTMSHKSLLPVGTVRQPQTVKEALFKSTTLVGTTPRIALGPGNVRDGMIAT
jgi:hypothetical protein